MSSSTVPKSPTSVADVPTFVLAPLVLMRNWRRSGNTGELTVRVQKVNTIPVCSVIGGVSNQLLKVEVPVPLLKSAAM